MGRDAGSSRDANPSDCSPTTRDSGAGVGSPAFALVRLVSCGDSCPTSVCSKRGNIGTWSRLHIPLHRTDSLLTEPSSGAPRRLISKAGRPRMVSPLDAGSLTMTNVKAIVGPRS